MATRTTNYQLVKPAMTDTADISVINGDMDIIDTELYRLSQRIDSATALSSPNVCPFFDHNTALAGTRYVSGFSEVTHTDTEHIDSVADGIATISIGHGKTFTATMYPLTRVQADTDYTAIIEGFSVPAGIKLMVCKSDSASQMTPTAEVDVKGTTTIQQAVKTRAAIGSSTKGPVIQIRNTGSTDATVKVRLSLFRAGYYGSYNPYSYSMQEIGALIEKLIADNNMGA